MTENWKDIRGYEGYYQVSDLGHFRSLDCERVMKNGVTRQHYGKELSPSEANDGYYVIDLVNAKGEKRTIKAHRLVAEQFIPNPLNLPIVNHRNENKHDNRSSNLEWCSIKYNLNYGTTQKRRAEKIGWKVRQFDSTGKYMRTFVTMRKASAILKLPMSGIYQSVLTNKSYKGYYFRKVNEEEK